ncbi:MAG: (deoxy)nucleoside triphosphate pyrophosphohydrolase [Candidatus Micrarchaeota archaeon]
MLVVAALIRRGGKVLVAQRRADCPREPLKWEFPGGKVESDEEPEEALAREIMEELGVRITVGELYCRSASTKGGTRVELLTYEARLGEGEPQALGCRDLKWAGAAELGSFDWAEADLPVVAKIKGDKNETA